MWSSLTSIDKYAKELSYPALISIAATQEIRRKGLTDEQAMLGLPQMSVSQSVLKDVCPVNQIVDCIPGKYRTYSGHCNNVNKPLWGAVYEPMQRLQNPEYADGVSVPRTGSKGKRLPSARIVSKTLFSESRPDHAICSQIIATWAQFVYEDLAQVGSNRLFSGLDSIPISCCQSTHPECFNIGTDNDDEVFRNRGLCMSYARSVVAPRENCSLGVREQANLVTSFLDGSHIYGNDKNQASSLRLFQNGQLKHKFQSEKKELLPSSADISSCGSPNPSQQPCFSTGSKWANLIPTTTSLHTLWLRQHNRIARKLKELNKYWDDERLYQESRRITIAQIQHITYNEFLPIIVGKEHLRSFGLHLQHHSFHSDYALNTNPSVLNEYAAAVGLFFFTLLPDTIVVTNTNGEQAHERHYSTLFNDPSHLYYRERLDGLIRTIIQNPIRKPGLHISKEFRERFLRGTDESGIDLAALIIQMGRDHGINSYTKWRAYCGLSEPRNFGELRPVVGFKSLITTKIIIITVP